jgi:hypothetical protein
MCGVSLLLFSSKDARMMNSELRCYGQSSACSAFREESSPKEKDNEIVDDAGLGCASISLQE